MPATPRRRGQVDPDVYVGGDVISAEHDPAADSTGGHDHRPASCRAEADDGRAVGGGPQDGTGVGQRDGVTVVDGGRGGLDQEDAWGDVMAFSDSGFQDPQQDDVVAPGCGRGDVGRPDSVAHGADVVGGQGRQSYVADGGDDPFSDRACVGGGVGRGSQRLLVDGQPLLGPGLDGDDPGSGCVGAVGGDLELLLREPAQRLRAGLGGDGDDAPGTLGRPPGLDGANPSTIGGTLADRPCSVLTSSHRFPSEHVVIAAVIVGLCRAYSLSTVKRKIGSSAMRECAKIWLHACLVSGLSRVRTSGVARKQGV